MSQVDVNIGALEALREDISVFAEIQAGAIAGIGREVERALGILNGLRADWVRERNRRELRLRECKVAALAALAAGEYYDCSGPEAALEEARRELQRVEDWLARVEQAASGWHASASRYQAYLDSTVPLIRAGLDARVTSLDAYESWRLGQAGLGGTAMSGLEALAARVDHLRDEKVAEEHAELERLAGKHTGPDATGRRSESNTGPAQASDHYPPGAGYGVEDREGPTLGPERR